MEAAKLVDFGPLKALQVDRNAQETIVMLHGYGANAWDLYPIKDWPGLSAYNWIFPNAPLEVPLGPMMMGRAWFPIDAEALEIAMRTGRFREFNFKHLPHFLEAKKLLENALSSLDLSYNKIHLGGFSQGSMLASDTALKSSENFRSLCIFSGTYIEEAGWEEAIQNKAQLPIFQSHGTSDPLLSFDNAKKLEALFQSASKAYRFISFNDGHTIPESVLNAWSSFLKEFCE